MSAVTDTHLLRRLERAAMEKLAMSPGLERALLLGGGAAAAAIPTYLVMKAHEEASRERARNVGFGAGVATGVAAPHIAQGLHSLLARMQAPQPQPPLQEQTQL